MVNGRKEFKPRQPDSHADSFNHCLTLSDLSGVEISIKPHHDGATKLCPKGRPHTLASPGTGLPKLAAEVGRDGPALESLVREVKLGLSAHHWCLSPGPLLGPGALWTLDGSQDHLEVTSPAAWGLYRGAYEGTYGGGH